MGFVLGGVLQGLGSGLQGFGEVRHRDALEKIRQKAEADQIARADKQRNENLYLQYGVVPDTTGAIPDTAMGGTAPVSAMPGFHYDRSAPAYRKQEQDIANDNAQEQHRREQNDIMLALHGYVTPGSATGQGPGQQAIPNTALGLQDVRGDVNIGDRSYVYDPNLDPSARRNDTTRDLASQRIRAMAEQGDKNRETRLTIHNTPSAPRPQSAKDTGPARAKWILNRIVQLTKPSKEFGMSKPGLSMDAAKAQAEKEVEAVYGSSQNAPQPAPAPGRVVTHDTPGDITLGAPQVDQAAMQREYDTAASKFKALIDRGVDHARAQQAYSQSLTAIGRKYGQVK